MKYFMAGMVFGLMVLGMVAHLLDRAAEAEWYMLLACAVGAAAGLVCRRDGEVGGGEKWPQGHISTGPQRCPECGGAAHDLNGLPCERCGGKGVVKQEAWPVYVPGREAEGSRPVEEQRRGWVVERGMDEAAERIRREGPSMPFAPCTGVVGVAACTPHSATERHAYTCSCERCRIEREPAPTPAPPPKQT